MKLRQANTTTNIAAAQIIGLSGKNVIVKTESGQILRLPLSPKKQHDQVFLASLKDIWHNKIWIPVNTHLHQLFQFDSLMEPVRADH